MALIAVPVIGWLVSPIISKVIGILHFKERWRLEKGVAEEIDHLNRVLPLIRGVLEDAEEKQSKNSGVLSWLGQLKDVLYDAEDVLDRYEVDLALMDERRDGEQLPTATGGKVSRRQLLPGLFSRRKSSVDISLTKNIKRIREMLDSICERGYKLGLQEMAMSASAPGNSTLVRMDRTTTPFLADESTVVGRADEKKAIIDMLLDNNSREKLLVLPIIGMGGVGKTTLARLVFNDNDVKDFFKSKAWVCIGMSLDLDLKRLMKEIITSVGTPQTKSIGYEDVSLDSLQETIVEEIKDKQPFLMVLDDAWDARVSSWEAFLMPFKASGLACRIILTTRNQQVVDAIRSDRHEPVRLSLLEENEMWSIFKRCAFDSKTVEVDRELEFVGRQIVQRLKGLPLAAKIIGGILRGNTDATHWKRISENKLFEIHGDENYMVSTLMLSYDNLPALLKQCFSYFSLFPKDYTFVLGRKRFTFYRDTSRAHVSRISNLWMSQGLINIEKGMALEDTGSGIIVQLLNRSLLHGIETFWGPSISIHDLVHDLVEEIAREEFLCVSGVAGPNLLPKNLRHISFVEEDSDTDQIAGQELEMLQNMKECRILRTLLFYEYSKKLSNYASLFDGCFNSLINLRALSLHNKYITSLPDSIGKLKLLRYLDLNLPRMEKLPDSVSSLYSLQVLVLVGCDRLSALNVSLTRLVNLVNLDIPEDMQTLKNIGRLTNLQQLEAFHIERQNGHTVTELRNLNEICGSLHVLNLENIQGKREAEEAGLHRKDGLEKLKFSWGDASSGPMEEELQSDVLEGLRPSTKLRKLTLIGYMGARLPNWLDGEHLLLLKAIKLHNCLKLRAIPFPSLTYGLQKLEICDSPNLVEMPSLPPSLQHLRLSDVGVTSLFQSSPWSSQSLPSLDCIRTLSVCKCPNLDESLSVLLKGSLPSLTSLDISDYSHSLDAHCHLTALSELHLSRCSGEVGIDVGALVSLKHLMVEDCPHAIIERNPNSAPSTSLSDLEIRTSPWLLQSQVSLASLRSLTIHGDDLGDSVLSGCLRDLSALETLVMRKCPNVRSIPNEVLLTLVSMETLSISSCERLEELDLLALRSLQWLEIESCPRLVFDRRQLQPSSSSSGEVLEDVRLCDFEAEQLAGLLSLLATCAAQVKSVSLLSYKRFTSGLGDICMLARLEELVVTRCKGLPSIFPSLTLLERLSIESCPDATSLPALESLRSLTVRDCPNVTFSASPTAMLFPSLEQLRLEVLSVQQLTHLIAGVAGSPLRRLLVEGCDDLISFDGGLEVPLLSLTSLQELEISRCARMSRLPSSLHLFTALRGLSINGCHGISSLPKEGLPVSLESLRVVGCPPLEAWCARPGGDRYRRRWISRNPFLEFEREQIPSSLFWPN